MAQNNYTPPDSNTVEISIFGSVVGESIIIHMGSNEWLIVDSCLHAESGKPAALHYLDALGIDPAVAVKLIVLTHWHDDHVTGASDIVNRCNAATLVCPAAMASDEFIQLLSTYAKPDFILDRETSALREFKRICETVEQRVNSGKPFAHNDWASANKLLYKSDGGSVIALSPSNRALAEANAEFARLVSEGRLHRRVPVAPDRNHNAVALWLTSSQYRALLGSDLEESAHPDDGWHAVLTCKHFPDGAAGTFKIPHHGSNNAHSDKVWHQLVRTNNAIAALTTYVRGAKLPKPSDVSRLKGKTSKVYCTTPAPEAIPKRDPAVERTMKETATERKTLRGRTTGHIRIRVDPSSALPHAEQVDLFGAAILLA